MVRYCKLSDCDRPRRTMRSGYTQERTESKYCKYHSCHSTNSYFDGFVLCENVAKPGSRFCAYHPKCRVTNCFKTRISEDDRVGRFFCDQHTCRGPNCRIPASGHDKRCEMHKECARGGCTKFRIKASDGRGWLPVCADHVIRRCYVQSCPGEARPGSVFCQYHKCLMDTCSGSKHPGSNYCVAHTCGDEGCHLPIKHPQNIVANRPRGCFYCDIHECKADHCHAQVKIDGGYCSNHGCTVQKCTNPRSSESNAGAYCIQHYTDSVRRSAEQIGREKEHAALLERQRKQREEQREREREERIARQQQQELDHLKAQRDAAVEAARAAKKQAERLEREEARRREIEEVERELRERERRRRRSYEASTVGSASLVDHPTAGGYHVPLYDFHSHGPETDHVFDTRTMSDSYFSSGDSESEDDAYLDTGLERQRHIPGVRHVNAPYSRI